jgi:hypothetical protein
MDALKGLYTCSLLESDVFEFLLSVRPSRKGKDKCSWGNEMRGGKFPIVLHLRGFVWKLTERADVVILLVVFDWKQEGGKRENSECRRVTQGNSFRDCLEKCYKASPSFRPKMWHAIFVADVPRTDLRPRLKPHIYFGSWIYTHLQMGQKKRRACSVWNFRKGES